MTDTVDGGGLKNNKGLAIGLGLVALGVGGALLALGGPVVVGAIAGAAIAVGVVGVGGGLGGFFGGGSGLGGIFGGGCFVEGTQVLMADLTHMSIENISVNDLVLSRHEKTGVMAGRRVSKVFVHDVDSILNLTLASGETIGTTEVHRFALGVNNFSPAKSIGVGTRLCTDASSTELLQRDLVRRKARVYNFTVDEFNTYFVGQDRVWVHNLKIGDPPDPSDDDP